MASTHDYCLLDLRLRLSFSCLVLSCCFHIKAKVGRYHILLQVCRFIRDMHWWTIRLCFGMLRQYGYSHLVHTLWKSVEAWLARQGLLFRWCRIELSDTEAIPIDLISLCAVNDLSFLLFLLLLQDDWGLRSHSSFRDWLTSILKRLERAAFGQSHVHRTEIRHARIHLLGHSLRPTVRQHCWFSLLLHIL